jgi:hypothetical protein
MVATLDISMTLEYPAVFYWGLSDAWCNDPLNDGIYSAKPYEARNTHPPHSGEPIPEVRKLVAGNVCFLTEPVERLWYHAWERKYPSLPLSEKLRIYKSLMRSNAGLTNPGGSDTNRSWVLNTNPTKEPMKYEGVVCPGGNLFRAVSADVVMKNQRPCIAIWTLDWQYISKLGVGDALLLAERLPSWLWHVAKIVHSDGSVTSWDYDFGYPMMTNSTSERAEIVDGFYCRVNYMRASRLVRI